MKAGYTILLILTLVVCNLQAQVLKEMFDEEKRIDTIPLRSLRVDVDAVAFFHDNEYSSQWQDGYSLPGVRLNPHLAYNPISQINIELGASMMFFNGANRYPCYAYHDIGTWKGNQYQHGAHVLPWVRLQAQFKHLSVILGNIYGGSNHELITPLFNPEQNLSADPEMGLQLLLKRKHIDLDVWLNWQSYQFNLDTHQEAFTVGTNARVMPFNQKRKDLKITFPIQMVIQHRGGEQDVTNMGVQTISNGSVGARVDYTPTHSKANSTYTFQANAMGSYQQSGKIWPFDTGFAWHAGLQGRWWNHLTASLDYLHAPKQFISLYGNPFYSTISLKNGGSKVLEDGSMGYSYDHQYDGLHNIRLGIDYQYTFAKAYTLGAAAELFCLNSKSCFNDTGKRNETNFSFGVYFRVSPSFLLKQFK